MSDAPDDGAPGGGGGGGSSIRIRNQRKPSSRRFFDFGRPPNATLRLKPPPMCVRPERASGDRNIWPPLHLSPPRTVSIPQASFGCTSQYLLQRGMLCDPRHPDVRKASNALVASCDKAVTVRAYATPHVCVRHRQYSLQGGTISGFGGATCLTGVREWRQVHQRRTRGVGDNPMLRRWQPLQTPIP